VTVVGVLPDTFDFRLRCFHRARKVDLFTPYIMDDFRDDGNDLALIGRLKPEVTLARHRARQISSSGNSISSINTLSTEKIIQPASLTELKEYVAVNYGAR